MAILSTHFGNIPLDELAGLPSFALPTLSYDRSKIAFCWDTTGQMELYVMGAAPGTEPRKLTNGEFPRTPRSGMCWTRDDKHILFAKDNDGDEQHNIWRVDVETGDIEQLTDNANAQEYPISVSPDNKTLLVGTNLKGQMNQFVLDLETKEYTQLTEYAFPSMGGTWHPGGGRIAYSANETQNFKNSDVYIMNADGSDKRQLLRMAVGSQDGVSDWSADGRYLAISSDYFGGNRIGIYDLEADELRWLSAEDDTIYPVRFSPDGSRLLAARNLDAAISTTIFDVETGEELSVELPPGMSYNAAWLDDERFIVNITTDVTRPELRDYTLKDGASQVLLPAEYGSIDPAVFAKHEYVSYESFDGLEIHAILYRPRDFDPEKTYPAIVEIHGGPTAQFFRGFNPYAQFLADAGYIIIQPNIRGSTGYGVDFRDTNLHDWGGGDLEDVEAAVKYLKALPEVNNERIGIWGGSYGGYMTFIAVTKKPDLWKAGVAVVGITDLKLLYDSSMDHFKYYLRQQMGDPEENADLWKDRSAVNFADQMTAHLFIMHGVNDPRCPIEQARVFRDALAANGKEEGKDFKYVELGEQGHGSADISQRTDTYYMLLDYFNEHL